MHLCLLKMLLEEQKIDVQWKVAYATLMTNELLKWRRPRLLIVYLHLLPIAQRSWIKFHRIAHYIVVFLSLMLWPKYLKCSSTIVHNQSISWNYSSTPKLLPWIGVIANESGFYVSYFPNKNMCYIMSILWISFIGLGFKLSPPRHVTQLIMLLWCYFLTLVINCL